MTECIFNMVAISITKTYSHSIESTCD